MNKCHRRERVPVVEKQSCSQGRSNSTLLLLVVVVEDHHGDNTKATQGNLNGELVQDVDSKEKPVGKMKKDAIERTSPFLTSVVTTTSPLRLP